MIQAADTASTNPLLPSWPEFIIGTILFLIVFGALAKFLLPRAQQTLAQRTEMIEGGLARSEEAQEEAKQLLDQYREQLAEDGLRRALSNPGKPAAEKAAVASALLHGKVTGRTEALVVASVETRWPPS